MNDPIAIAKSLRKEIEKTPEYQEYSRYQKLIENDTQLAELRKNIVRAKNENRSEEYNQLSNQYNNHVLVVNYLRSKEELSSLLKTMQNIIQ